jgi:hypothetical protein
MYRSGARAHVRHDMTPFIAVASIIVSITMLSEIAASTVEMKIQIELDGYHNASMISRSWQFGSTEID